MITDKLVLVLNNQLWLEINFFIEVWGEKNDTKYFINANQM